jgi:hypothetical protein
MPMTIPTLMQWSPPPCEVMTVLSSTNGVVPMAELVSPPQNDLTPRSWSNFEGSVHFRGGSDSPSAQGTVWRWRRWGSGLNRV